MPLKTEAICTVLSEELNLSHMGIRRTLVAGDTVKLPSDVAKDLADDGAVRIDTPADNT